MLTALRVAVGVVIIGLAIRMWTTAAADTEGLPARIRPLQTISNRGVAAMIGLLGLAILVTAPF